VTLPTPDCSDFDPGQVSVTTAWERLAAAARIRVGRERVALAAAAGRVLATDLIAGRDVPAFTNVAVDGWACRQADLEAMGGVLRIAPGRAAAGHPHARPLEPGTAVRVLTGAPLPEGADTVVMEEEAQVEGDRIRLPAAYPRGRGVRPAGEDIRRGTTVIPAGTVLRPQHLGVAASLGQAELEVFRPLRIALFSSGDELAEPGAALGPGGIWDVNRPVLRALLRHLPATLTDLGILPDREPMVREAVLAAASAHDVVLTSGGASRGDEDHLARTLAACGRLHFWRVAMKPGRPLALGELGDALVITLPGNPVAAMVGFALFARPLLLALAGADFAPPQFVDLPAAFSMMKRGGRSEVLRARLLRNDAGRLAVARIEREGSGILTSMTEAHGLVLLREGVERVAPGDLVPFADFATLGIA
jgi:molybdopterin molybdotransferase